MVDPKGKILKRTSTKNPPASQASETSSSSEDEQPTKQPRKKTKRTSVEEQIRLEVTRQLQEIMRTIYPGPVIPYAPTTYTRPPATPTGTPTFCRYCKRSNHTIENCYRKRK